jgi:hypothetical protein
MESELDETTKRLTDVEAEVEELKERKKKADKVLDNLLEYFADAHKKSGKLHKTLKKLREESESDVGDFCIIQQNGQVDDDIVNI